MRYAKLTEPLKCQIHAGTVTLPAGTEIKNVSIVDGLFTFDAHVRVTGAWVRASFSGDLPAFTDRGSAARTRRATLKPGRPRVSSATLTQRLVCKVTDEQAAAVEVIAEKEATNVPGLIRKALIERGMPE